MNATNLIQGPVIEVMITLDANQEPKVTYLQDGEVCTGSVVVTCGEDITYRLVNSAGYAFMGAGFLTPYDNIIDSVQVSADGQELVLVDDAAAIPAALQDPKAAILMLTHVNYRTGAMHDMAAVTAAAHAEAGTEFNVDSPKQLQQILYEKMNTPIPIYRWSLGWTCWGRGSGE